MEIATRGELAIERFEVNDFSECTYLLYREGGGGIVIDAGFLYEDEWASFERFIEDHHIALKLLLNTHGHVDHVCGVGRAASCWNLPFALHPADAEISKQKLRYGGPYATVSDGVPAPAMLLEDGQKIAFEGIEIEVIATPGHTQGGCCFYLPEMGVLFSGDTLFAGSIGRTDLGGGNYEQLLASIREKLFTLPGETVVLPGHGPQTTIALELETNPFFRERGWR